MSETDDRHNDNEIRSAFDRAVEQAAEIAAKRIAKISMSNLVRKTAIITAICCLGIMGVTSYLLYTSAKKAARNNAIYDCKLFRKASDDIGNFITEDIKLRIDQNKTGLTKQIVKDFSKIFPPKVITKAEAENIYYLKQAIAAWNVDAQKLKGLSDTRCISKLGG